MAQAFVIVLCDVFCALMNSFVFCFTVFQPSVSCLAFFTLFCRVLLEFNVALRPHRPYGLLGTGAQDGHLDFHTAFELFFGHLETTMHCLK